ncbi:MAG: tRNA (adenosine(37)-N6)-dimethylallyltransferase MiaA [Hyphomicrobiales bacterium]|nr:MAG: tRNA (adenosine(37)-N6)-dimethylallyltransferase MiaA [Hyphomicrobiales bacterium]
MKLQGKRAVLIAGPTASGKSAMALRLAAEHDGVVINTDSMQVYDVLSVLTARPDADDLAQAPHVLYGHVPPAESYSVGQWLQDAAAAIAEAEAAGRLPIVVGGTGLYFKTLTEGLVELPPVPDEIRSRLRARAEEEGAPALHAELSQRDPEMAARLVPSEPQRIIRALEVLETTGRSLAEWQREPATPILPRAETMRCVLSPERPVLHARIEQRFSLMMEAGALDEVKALLALDLEPTLSAMKAIGVRPLGAYLAGEIALDEAIRRSVVETRRYAKRQMTFFNGQLRDWERVTS